MSVLPFPKPSAPRFTDKERAALVDLERRNRRGGLLPQKVCWLRTEFRELPTEAVFYVWFDDAPPGYAMGLEGCQRLAITKRPGCFVVFEREPGSGWERYVETNDFAFVLIALARRTPR